jgi:hypothetical protein
MIPVDPTMWSPLEWYCAGILFVWASLTLIFLGESIKGTNL